MTTTIPFSGAEVRVLALATHFILSDNLPILEQRLEALGARAEDASVVDAVLKDMEVRCESQGGPEIQDAGVCLCHD